MADFLPPGLHRISADRYHADPMKEPSLSSTLARIIIGQSPFHAWTKSPRLNPEFTPKETKAFDIGRAFHREMLGEGEDYVVVPEDLLSEDGGVRSKAAREFVGDCRARGLTPIKAEEAAAVRAMVANARGALADMGMTIDPAHSEVAVLAEIDGVSCRALIDNLPPRKPYFVDLKSCVDASPSACISAVTNHGIDVQIAHYRDCLKAVTGEDRACRLVFVEKTPPYEVGVVELFDGRHIADLMDPDRAADWMEDAHEKAGDARVLWRRCLDTGRWPGYPRQIATIGAPSYYRQKWASRPALPEKPSKEATAAAHAWQAPTGEAA